MTQAGPSPPPGQTQSDDTHNPVIHILKLTINTLNVTVNPVILIINASHSDYKNTQPDNNHTLSDNKYNQTKCTYIAGNILFQYNSFL